MGWSGGSQLAILIWDAVRDYIPQEKRKEVARNIIRAFFDYDCDTMDEAEELWRDGDMTPDEYL